MTEDANMQMLRTVIDYGRDALKAVMLINGGAAIALLAFIGTIWSSESDPDTILRWPREIGQFDKVYSAV